MWRSQSQGMTLRRDVPTAWQSLAVDALAVQKKGAVKIGPFGSQLKKNELRIEGVRVYGQENVLQDDFRLGNRFIDDAKFDSLRSVRLFAGDVVLTMMGSVGAATVVPDGIPTGIMDSHLLRIQPNTSVIEPEFLAKVLRDSSEIKKQIRARSQGGIMSGLNARIVRSLEVPVPPLPEQRKIAAILSSVDDAIEKTQAVIDKVQVVKRCSIGPIVPIWSGRLRFSTTRRKCHSLLICCDSEWNHALGVDSGSRTDDRAEAVVDRLGDDLGLVGGRRPPTASCCATASVSEHRDRLARGRDGRKPAPPPRSIRDDFEGKPSRPSSLFCGVDHP